MSGQSSFPVSSGPPTSSPPSSDPPSSGPPQGNPSDGHAEAEVGPEDRMNLELRDHQFPPIAEMLPGDVFPDWLLDLYYEVDRIVDPPGNVGRVRQPPTFKPDARWEVEVPSREQQDSDPVTHFRAFMLNPAYTPAGDSPESAEQWNRPDIVALRELAKHELVRAKLSRAETDVDLAKGAVEEMQKSFDEETQRGNKEAIQRVEAALSKAKYMLTNAEEDLMEPQEVWDSLVEQYNEDTPTGAHRLDPVVDAHLQVKMAAGKIVSDAKKPVLEWIKQLFDTLKALDEKERIFPPKPEDFRVGGAYVNTTLYIITMPEFAFNGWLSPAKRTIWNAAYPFHEDLERFIYEQLRKTLRETYPHVRVLFAFSCCTYSSDLFFQVRLDGEGDVGNVTGALPRRKLASANRITIVSSAGPVRPRRITKFLPSDIDGWPTESQTSKVDLFTVANLLDHSGPRSVARFSEILYMVKDQFGGKYPDTTDEDGNVVPGRGDVLAFGTCLDVAVEDHRLEGAPDINMCVYLGGALPLDDIRDSAHPFILNDVFSKDWPGTKNGNRWAPGWYHFSPNPVRGQESVAQTWEANSSSKVDKNSVAWRLYWDRGATTAGVRMVPGGPKINYTKEIPMPAAPAKPE